MLAPDVFLTGESGSIAGRIRVKNEETYLGYNTGYNRTVFAERVSDVLTAIGFARNLGGTSIALAGRGKAGAWVLAARALAGDTVARAAVDLGGFDFDQVRETTDAALLPGAVKYGGVRGLASLAGPGPTSIAGAPASPVAPWLPLPAAVSFAPSPATPDGLAEAALKP